MELLGRDTELLAVEGAVHDVVRGEGRALGVLGEAGIGKSAMLAAIGDRARRRGLLVLEGRGAEHERAVPFGVAVDALDDHVATLARPRIEALGRDLPDVLPAAAAHAGAPASVGGNPAERFRYHRAIRALLELLGRERPVALLLDDLHWADEASVELVLHLLRRPPAVPHLLAFALRPVDPASRLLDAARSAPGWERLALEPLGHDASLGLLTGVPDPAMRERLAREAGGNPLFLRELARATGRPDGALPPTLVAAVALEVAALDPRSRALIEGAAVAGDPFDPELAAAPAGIAPDTAALDALVAADLVRPSGRGRGFAFRHPLVRRAVYDASPPARRLEAHERVDAALERRGASAAARAYHVERFARPGDEAAIAVLVEAAQAVASTAPATTAARYAAALRLVPETDTRRRMNLLGPLALALGSAGRLEDAHAALAEVLQLMPAAPTPQRLALVSACAQIETELGRHGDARRRLLAALADAPHESRASLTFELAAAAFYDGRLQELHTWTDPAVHAASEAGEPLLLAGAEGLGAMGALWIAEQAQSAELLHRATTRLAELDDASLAAQPVAPVYVATAQLLCERFADAEATIARALDVSRRAGQGQLLIPQLNVRTMALVNLLRLDDAQHTSEASEESARLLGVPRLMHFSLWLRGLVHHVRGAAAEAERIAEECDAMVGGLEPSKLTRSGTCTLAAIRADQDPEWCIHRMVATAGPELETADPTWRSWLLLRLVRAAAAMGRLEEAERWARLAAADGERFGLPAGAVRAACAQAELLLARGEPSRAAALARQAAGAAERSSAQLDAAEARLLAGRALAAAGEAEDAKTMLQRVAADAGRGQALRLRDAAARELRRAGSRISAEGRRAARGGDHSRLTPREHDIVRLVTEGHSNKQVAAALFLSEKTIEGALTRIYAKVGVRSRAQLAGARVERREPATR